MRKLYTLLAILVPIFGWSQADTTDIPSDTLGIDQSAITVLSANDLEDGGQSQDLSGLLQASRDVFNGIAGFNFSAARFRIRGYDSHNFEILVNGIPMNDPELGFPIWANWGGLNDVTRYPEDRPGIASNPYHFSSIGGYSNINMRATSMRAGTRISQAVTNRSYRNRTMLTHSTGLMDNGWAFSGSLSFRWAEEGYVEGTSYSAMSYFGSAEKVLNDKHRFGIVAFGAPTVRGRSGISQQEIYDLTGNNFYNPYWGYQDGEKRNSRVRSSHKPTFFVWDELKLSEKFQLTTTVYGQVGKYGQTRLNWYDAKDPRPDYYRYLPSYFEEEDPTMVDDVTALWQNDQSYSQINWDQLYFANSKNLFQVLDAENTPGNTVVGNRSKYILEEGRSDPRMLGVNLLGNYKLNDELTIDAGLHVNKYKSINYKLMNDLLGGDFWLDLDQFAARDFADEDVAQNNTEFTNNLIYEGEEFGYEYEIHIQKSEAFAQLEHRGSKIDAFAALTAGQTRVWRDGAYANGKFPENSAGESEKRSFNTYGLKGGLMYKITGRHMVSFNAVSMTRAPVMRNVFLSARTRNDFAANLEPEEVMGVELNYHMRYPGLKMRLTGFHTTINNQIWNRSFWHDELNSFVNYAMTGVDHIYTGMEFGFDAQVSPTVSLRGAITHGQYLYNSRPTATITVDNSNEVIDEGRTVYLKNYKIGGRPHTAANLGLTYRAPKYWFVGTELNVFGNMMLDPNPDRRTSEAVNLYVDTDPQWTEVLQQEELENGGALNMFMGKSWRFDYKYYLLITLNITNVLDNTDFRTGGYEQLRYDPVDINRFPSRYGYMYGRTYFAMVRFSF